MLSYEYLQARARRGNPWSVDSVSQFLYYCCPQCPSRTRELKSFIKHAKLRHNVNFSDDLSLCDAANLAHHVYGDDQPEPPDNSKPFPMTVRVPKKLVEFTNDSDGDDEDDEVTATIPYKNYLNLITESVEESDQMKVCRMTDKWGRNKQLYRYQNKPYAHPPHGRFNIGTTSEQELKVGKFIETWSDIDNVSEYASDDHEQYEVARQRRRNLNEARSIIRNTLGSLEPMPLDDLVVRAKKGRKNQKQVEVAKPRAEPVVVSVNDISDSSGTSSDDSAVSDYNDEPAEAQADNSAFVVAVSEEAAKAKARDEKEAIMVNKFFEHELKQKKQWWPPPPPSDMSLNCPYCPENFTSRFSRDVLPHMNEKHPLLYHPRGLIYNCPDDKCDYANFLKAMKNHVALHPDVIFKPYPCPECDAYFTVRADLMSHFQEDHKEVFDSKIYQRRSVHDKRLFCDGCGKNFKSQDTLEFHRKLHHTKDKSIQDVHCDQCDYKTYDEYWLKRHKREKHTINKRFMCEYCPDEGFPYQFYLDLHLELKHKDKIEMRYTCEVCSKQFYVITKYRQHIKQAHKPATTRRGSFNARGRWLRTGPKKSIAVTCEYCNEVCKSTSYLYEHCKSHHPNFPPKAVGMANFTCEHCSETFLTKFRLKRHFRKVHGILTQPYYCEKCDIPYTHQHKCFTGTQQCEYCDKVYGKAQSLLDHIKSVHLNQNDYPCPQCDKAFPSQGSLRMHTYNHHEKTECKFCRKICSSKWEHKRHLVLAHRQTKGALFCPKCPKKVFFTWKKKSQHMEKEHNIVMSPTKRR